MSFCNHCGKPLKEGQTFCTSCGQKVAVKNEGTEKTETARQEVKAEKPIKKGPVIAVFVSVFLLLALAGTYFVLDSIHKPEKLINSFAQAVEKEDYEQLKEILQAGKTDVELTEESLQGFVMHLTENHDFQEIKRELNRELRRAENGSKPKPILDYNGNEILEIKEGKKALLIFDQYELAAKPLTLKLAANFENVDVKVNGGEAKMIQEAEEPEEFGKFLPGPLEIEAVYEGEYTTLEENFVVGPGNAVENVIEEFVYLQGETVYVFSNVDEAILFVNGKSTGMKVGDVDYFGPIATDGSIALHAEIDGVKSDTVKLTSSRDAYLWFDLNMFKDESEWSETDLENFMKDYLSTSVEAINERDFEIVEELLDPEGNAYDESKNYIDHLDSKGITEELIDVVLIDYEETDEGFTVKTYDEYIIYNDGSSTEAIYESVYELRWSSDDKKTLRVYSLESTDEI